MDLKDISEGDIVCLRDRYDNKWILMTKWTKELSDAYSFAHSLPIDFRKNNREPIFPDAVYIQVEIENQTPEKLFEIYQSSDIDRYRNFRTKIIRHDLLYLLKKI